MSKSNIYTRWIKVFAIIAIHFGESGSQRRITNGHIVTSEKRYMVYLLQAPPQNFTAWLCGGAIISPYHIITSAACVSSVPHAYVISGYRKYVNAKDMDRDKCVKLKRKKIIKTCMPKGYNHEQRFHSYNHWNWADIAIAKVDSPFAFNDVNYKIFCSYIPKSIPVGMEPKFHREGLDVITLGWGHAQYYRPEGLDIDMNEPLLRYSVGRITSVPHCLEKHKVAFDQVSFTDQLKYYWICVSDPGNLDENGNIIIEDRDFYNTCHSKFVKQVSGRTKNDTSMNVSSMNDTSLNHTLEYKECASVLRGWDENFDQNSTANRVGGFCQNDHGGPLITWIGGREKVIGIANSFAVTDDMQCRTPYLYTSTAGFNKVLACHLWKNYEKGANRRSMYCTNVLAEANFIEEDIQWPEDSYEELNFYEDKK